MRIEIDPNHDHSHRPRAQVYSGGRGVDKEGEESGNAGDQGEQDNSD